MLREKGIKRFERMRRCCRDSTVHWMPGWTNGHESFEDRIQALLVRITNSKPGCQLYQALKRELLVDPVSKAKCRE